MSPIVLASMAVVLAALAASGVAYSLAGAASSPALRARRRVRKHDAHAEATEDYHRAAFLMRIVAMSATGLPNKIATALMPYAAMSDPSGSRRDSSRLIQAGLSSFASADDVLRARAWTGFLVSCGLAFVYHSSPLLAVVLALLGFILGVRLPSFTIAAAAEARQRQCIKDLPEMIEIISLASWAGMSFDAGLAAYAGRFETALSREFGAALDRWSVGAMTREEALLAVSQALDVDVVTRFVTAVLQALRLGSPLARVLQDQAEDARKSQRMALEELIAKAPVKIFLPMGTLILPAMLVLMLGPIMLQLLSGMGAL